MSRIWEYLKPRGFNDPKRGDAFLYNSEAVVSDQLDEGKTEDEISSFFSLRYAMSLFFFGAMGLTTNQIKLLNFAGIALFAGSLFFFAKWAHIRNHRNVVLRYVFYLLLAVLAFFLIVITYGIAHNHYVT